MIQRAILDAILVIDKNKLTRYIPNNIIYIHYIKLNEITIWKIGINENINNQRFYN